WLGKAGEIRRLGTPIDARQVTPLGEQRIERRQRRGGEVELLPTQVGDVLHQALRQYPVLGSLLCGHRSPSHSALWHPRLYRAPPAPVVSCPRVRGIDHRPRACRLPGQRRRDPSGRSKVMAVQRSMLAVPGANWRMIEKALASAADTIFLDLEDAVAPDAKATGRETVIRALRELDWGSKPRIFRMNALD